MNCDWQDIGESPKVPGFRYYTCRRRTCWIDAHSPYGPERVRNAEEHQCKGWPHHHEWGHWIGLSLEVICIRKPAVAWLNYKLGFTEVPECNCAERERWLNTLGGKLCSSTNKYAQWLARWLVARKKKPGPT